MIFKVLCFSRSAIYANRRYLDSYKVSKAEELVQNEPGKPEIVGNKNNAYYMVNFLFQIFRENIFRE